MNIYKDQSNLPIGGIAANWGFRPQNFPFPWQEWGPCLTQCYLGPHECPCQMACQGARMRQTYRQTDRRTDHAKAISVAIGGIKTKADEHEMIQDA